MKSTLKDDRGIALVVVIFVGTILLTLTGASLLFSRLDLKAASSLKTGTGALHVADVGIQHALALIPSGTEFDSLLQGSVSGFTCSGACDGVSIQPTLAGSLSGYTYSVVADDDADEVSPTPPAPTDDKNKVVILTSTANGPNSSKRKIKAYIGRSNSSWAPPGAIYIPGGSSSDADFNTSGTFFIDGKDTNYSADNNNDGRADSISSGPQSPIYGVAALYDSMVTEFINSLSSSEKSKVQGNGYNDTISPVTPSVSKTTTSFSVTDLANNLKAQAGAAQYLSGLSRNQTECPTPPPVTMSANCVFGTDEAPQITYIKADTGVIRFDTNSTVKGSGVLILDGKANLFGNFEFHGIVISLAPGPRGDESDEANIKLKLKDNARIFGSVLLGPTNDDLKFDIKGNAAVYYSSQALNLVRDLWGSLLPQPARVIAWQEVTQ